MPASASRPAGTPVPSAQLLEPHSSVSRQCLLHCVHHGSALRDRAARYRSLVPSILYTVTTTRADAAYMTGILCRTLDNPTSKHCDAAEMLFSYLVTTKTMGICYGGDHIERQLKTVYSPLKDGLTALSDSNWTADKSISAFLIYLAGGLIMWASKRQPVTSLSSTEAEYYAASACGAEVLAIRYFLSEITGNAHPLATPVYVDNSGCVNLLSLCQRQSSWSTGR